MNFDDRVAPTPGPECFSNLRVSANSPVVVADHLGPDLDLLELLARVDRDAAADVFGEDRARRGQWVRTTFPTGTSRIRSKKRVVSVLNPRRIERRARAVDDLRELLEAELLEVG